MSPPPLSVCPFSEENAALRKEVESLRQFKRTIWSEAIEGLRGWASREGLDVGQGTAGDPVREPSSCKVLPFPTDPNEFEEEPTDIWAITPLGETPLEEAIAQSIESQPTSYTPADLDPTRVDPAEVDPTRVDPVDLDPTSVDPLFTPTRVDPLFTPTSLDPPSALRPMSIPSSNLTLGERRKFPRVPIQQSVRFCVRGWEHTVRARVGDLSLGGMSIQSDKLPEVGAEVACGFHPAGEHGSPILAKGRVVWASQESQGFGIKFIKIETKHLVQIADIVRERGGYPEPTIPGWPMSPLI